MSNWIKMSLVWFLASSYSEVVKPEVLTDFEDVKKVEEKKPEKASVGEKKKKFCASCSPKNTLEKLKNSRYLSYNFYKNNPSYLIAFLVYIGLSVLFIILQLTVIHPNIPWYVAFARAAAILIYFNSDLIVICVLRRIVTWFRNTRVGKLMNFFDEFVEFHKAMGILIFILSFIHTLGQCINLCKQFLLLKKIPYYFNFVKPY